MSCFDRPMHRTAAAILIACTLSASSALSAQQQPPAAGVPQRTADSVLVIRARGQLAGEAAAQGTSTSIWAVGAGATLFLGGLGLVSPLIAANADVEIPGHVRMVIAQEDTAYQAAFESAYKRATKSKRVKATVVGLIVAPVAAFAVVAIIGLAAFAHAY